MVFFTGDFLYPLRLLLLSLDDLFRTLATPLGLRSARLHVGEAQGRQAGGAQGISISHFIDKLGRFGPVYKGLPR
jgi:hypothetical protein